MPPFKPAVLTGRVHGVLLERATGFRPFKSRPPAPGDLLGAPRPLFHDLREILRVHVGRMDDPRRGEGVRDGGKVARASSQHHSLRYSTCSQARCHCTDVLTTAFQSPHETQGSSNACNMAEQASLDAIFPEWRLNECHPRDPGVIDVAWNGEGGRASGEGIRPWTLTA